jgi:hypothetical protein
MVAKGLTNAREWLTLTELGKLIEAVSMTKVVKLKKVVALT